jgi:hypothetical protein
VRFAFVGRGYYSSTANAVHLPSQGKANDVYRPSTVGMLANF